MYKHLWLPNARRYALPYLSLAKDLPPNRAMVSDAIRRFSVETEKGKTKRMVARMRQRIEEDHSVTKESGWDKLWQEGVTPWDLNLPTPALEAELAASKWNRLDGTSNVLVPGCGSGFDLVVLARHQERLQRMGLVRDSLVVGLDISVTSLKRAEEVLRNDLQTTPTTPCVTLAHGDFFDCDTWNSVFCSHAEPQRNRATTSFEEGMFDFIYDYVFFCALPPNLRESWGAAVSSLLKPGTGRLLTIMFPVLQNPEMKGPPFPVTVEDYQKVLEPKGVLMESGPFESPHSVPERADKELLCWWRRKDNLRSNL